MKILPLSLEKALNYVPEEKTYAIRIFSSTQKYFGRLSCSRNYIHIASYVFDEDTSSEIEREIRNYGKIFLPTTLFTENIAKSMIKEFIPFREESKSLLVHCVGGDCRSKAIGKGFNDLFGFENKEELFLNSYGQLQCKHLYDTFMKAGRKIKNID